MFGLTAVAITTIVSGSAVALYGMKIIDRKAGNLADGVRAILQELPAIRAALPPVLSDALSDQRRPDYASRLKIDVALNGD